MNILEFLNANWEKIVTLINRMWDFTKKNFIKSN